MITTVEVNQKLKVCSTACSNQIHHFDQRDWSVVGAFLGKKKTYLVEMRLKTALKLLQLREKRTAEAEARSSAACWWPSRYVWMK